MLSYLSWPAGLNFCLVTRSFTLLVFVDHWHCCSYILPWWCASETYYSSYLSVAYHGLIQEPYILSCPYIFSAFATPVAYLRRYFLSFASSSYYFYCEVFFFLVYKAFKLSFFQTESLLIEMRVRKISRGWMEIQDFHYIMFIFIWMNHIRKIIKQH